MSAPLPLPTLLSHALVAFTIEFDNEAEHRMPHRTTEHGRTPGTLPAPWFVSMAMWFNCMQFVTDAGVTVHELQRLARTGTNLDGMRRWGYITITPDTAASRSKQPKPDALLRPTTAGKQAQAIWQPLVAEIEERWRKRFGENAIGRLRNSLQALLERCDAGLPDCMPILGYGLAAKVSTAKKRQAKPAPSTMPVLHPPDRTGDLPLPVLLARLLVAFTAEFEQESEVSLAVCANLLRIISDGTARVRDLPRRSGVSKEATPMALGFVKKRGLAVITNEPGSRMKAISLTRKGRSVREAYLALLHDIDERWQLRFGLAPMRELRSSLEVLVEAKSSQLFHGLEPYRDGWRAALPLHQTLPHYPAVLHRGGFPDGS